MPQEGTIFRALIASPGDCEHERKIIPEVIRAWNAVHSVDRAVIVEPVLWETHSRPQLGERPQQIINDQLISNCDLLIGAFWTKLGTPTGKAQSGTAEEIEEFRSQGKPVMLYFSSAPAVPDSIDQEQYRALSKYRDKLGELGLYSRYESLPQFREQMQNHFSSEMISLINKQGKAHSKNPEIPSANLEDEHTAAIKQYVSDFNSFLRTFEAEWNAERRSEPMGTQDGKYILENAHDNVLHFQSMITTDGSGLTEKFSAILVALKKLQRHKTYMDGGVSFKQFWNEGDKCISALKKISSENLIID